MERTNRRRCIVAKKMPSVETRIRRIRTGYLAAGRKGLKNTAKVFGGTRTQGFAGPAGAKLKKQKPKY